MKWECSDLDFYFYFADDSVLGTSHCERYAPRGTATSKAKRYSTIRRWFLSTRTTMVPKTCPVKAFAVLLFLIIL
jgi:hypothetical protein